MPTSHQLQNERHYSEMLSNTFFFLPQARGNIFRELQANLQPINNHWSKQFYLNIFLTLRAMLRMWLKCLHGHKAVPHKQLTASSNNESQHAGQHIIKHEDQ